MDNMVLMVQLVSFRFKECQTLNRDLLQRKISAKSFFQPLNFVTLKSLHCDVGGEVPYLRFIPVTEVEIDLML